MVSVRQWITNNRLLVMKRFLIILTFLLLYPSVYSIAQDDRTIILSRNKGFAEQLNQQNVTYEITCDFDLKNKTVLVPNGSKLRFSGGCIKSGVLKGSNTEIVAGKQQIFENVTFSGVWSNDVAYPEWFGAKGDGKNDDSKAIQACIDASFNRIVLQAKETAYLVMSPLFITRPIIIEGGSGSGANSYAKIKAGKKIHTIFQLKKGCVRSRFTNLYVDGNNKSECGFYSPQEEYESYLYSNTFANVKVVFADFGYRLNKIYSCVFNSCQANSISKIGFCFNMDLTDGSEGTTITAINCGSSTWNKEGGIGWYFNKMTYCSLMNCGSDDNDIAYQFRDCSNFSLLSSGCEKCGTPFYFDYDGYSMGFVITAFRITDLKQQAPYDWVLYSGGLYNTTLSGIHLNSKNKRKGDIYTRFAGSSITVLDKSSISPKKSTLVGTAVLFPTLAITRNIMPDYEGQIYIDKGEVAIAKKENGSLTWNDVYRDQVSQIKWISSIVSNEDGGLCKAGRMVSVNARFTSGVTSTRLIKIAEGMPENAIPESFLRITDENGVELDGVVAKIAASELQIVGLEKNKRYYLSGTYLVK